MESKNTVMVGSPIPITVQLHDGAINRTVNVVVFDPIGQDLGSVRLSSGPGGFYWSNGFAMPDAPWVAVVATVDGLDLLGQEYSKGAELFYSAPRPVAPEKVFRGALIKTREAEKIFKGVLIETEG